MPFCVWNSPGDCDGIVRGVRAAKTLRRKEQLALRVIGEADPAVAVIVSKTCQLK